MRALFDYDAFDDAYLPCRELGLSFQKGEVLKIMSTDDEDWWQAHHDADDDTHLTLAGLIPSHRFQTRLVVTFTWSPSYCPHSGEKRPALL